MTWDEGVKKEYDKGKSVRHASKTRKQQFERAMDLANEAFSDTESGDTEYSRMEEGIEENSPRQGYNKKNNINNEGRSSSRIPREIGQEPNIFRFKPNFDWRSIRNRIVSKVKALDLADLPPFPDNSFKRSVTQKDKGNWQIQLVVGVKVLYIGMFPEEHKRRGLCALELLRNELYDAATRIINSNTGSNSTKDDAVGPSSRNSNSSKTGTLLEGPPGSVSVSNKLSANDASTSKPEAVDFGTFTDRKPVQSRHNRSVARADPKQKTQTSIELVNALQSPQAKEPPTSQKKIESLEDEETKTDETVKQKTKQKSKPLKTLTARERDELLLNTAFCHYYLLPLSEL